MSKKFTALVFCLSILGFAPRGQADPVLPDFGAAVFVDSTQIDHSFFPLIPGTLFVYAAESDEEGEFRLESRVTNETRTILDVEARVVRSREWVDGLLVEKTDDWFAQDAAGNVWYLGEATEAFEYDDAGILIETNNDGAWEAGINDASPGWIMKAVPAVGDNYYQEFAEDDEAIDQAEVTDLNRTISSIFGDLDVLETLEFTELEPDAFENKLYAAGIGLVLIEEGLDDIGMPSFVIPLVSVEVVPEPTTALLLGAGLLLLGSGRRRLR